MPTLLELHGRCVAFVVNAPNNFKHSNGIRVLLDAIRAARRLGIEAVLVPAEQIEPSYRTLSPPFQDLPIAWQVPEGCFAIVGDTCSPERLAETRARAFQVCHYSLAPLGLFRNAGPYSNFQLLLPGERQAVYSPQISTRLPYFYLQTRFQELEEVLAKKPQRPYLRRPRNTIRLCLYAGKGKLRPLIHHGLRSRTGQRHATLLNRLQPATKHELYRSLSAADLLISFDPISSLNHEAILLGTPTLVLADWDENEFLDQFPVSLTGMVWNNFDRALEMVDHGFDHAAVLVSYNQALSRNIDSLLALIAYAISPSPSVANASELNAYWSGRQDFFASLQLPSGPPDWGPLEKAMPPLTFGERLSDLPKAVRSSMLAKYKNKLLRVKCRLRRCFAGFHVRFSSLSTVRRLPRHAVRGASATGPTRCLAAASPAFNRARLGTRSDHGWNSINMLESIVIWYRRVHHRQASSLGCCQNDLVDAKRGAD